ncbi:hypothetical protein KCA24_28550, partial [Escherichia coli]|nr:hypothetical protein [Escherichia coli]
RSGVFFWYVKYVCIGSVVVWVGRFIIVLTDGLKLDHEAGGRGGERHGRLPWCLFYFLGV